MTVKTIELDDGFCSAICRHRRFPAVGITVVECREHGLSWCPLVVFPTIQCNTQMILHFSRPYTFKEPSHIEMTKTDALQVTTESQKREL